MAPRVDCFERDQLELRNEEFTQLADGEPLARLPGLGGADPVAALVNPGIDAGQCQQASRPE